MRGAPRRPLGTAPVAVSAISRDRRPGVAPLESPLGMGGGGLA